jgi:hypothetical protein
MLSGVEPKSFAKRHPKPRKITSFNNIKSNINDMKTYKTSFMHDKNKIK